MNLNNNNFNFKINTNGNLIQKYKNNIIFRTRNLVNKKTAKSLSPMKNNLEFENDLLPPLSKDNGMKTLVLDLDETLVHSTFDQIVNSDLIITMELDNEIHDVYVMVRPGVFEFLEELSKIYEIVIFTASLSRVRYLINSIVC
jgi:TFIIF-interacting CTD phosphatase-like protein